MSCPAHCALHGPRIFLLAHQIRDEMQFAPSLMIENVDPAMVWDLGSN
jgi:hypothetical protein